MRRAIFLDRDGILNEITYRDGKAVSPRTLAEFRLAPDARELVDAVRDRDFLAIVVTNQPDIGRWLMAGMELDEMHRRLALELPVDGIEVATSGDDSDPRRKPNPGMLLHAAALHGIDLEKSWIVGDSDKDLEAGRRAGVGTILLETDYNKAIHGKAMHNFVSLKLVATFIRSL